MTADSFCPLPCGNSACRVIPLLHSLIDKVDALSDTMELIQQAPTNKKAKEKKSSKETACRICLDQLILALQMKFPEKNWTSEDFAQIIGCSAATIRQTKEWREYQERCRHEKQKRSKPKGSKDKHGNLEAFYSDEQDDS